MTLLRTTAFTAEELRMHEQLLDEVRRGVAVLHRSEEDLETIRSLRRKRNIERYGKPDAFGLA